MWGYSDRHFTLEFFSLVLTLRPLEHPSFRLARGRVMVLRIVKDSGCCIRYLELVTSSCPVLGYFVCFCQRLNDNNDNDNDKRLGLTAKADQPDHKKMQYTKNKN